MPGDGWHPRARGKLMLNIEQVLNTVQIPCRDNFGTRIQRLFIIVRKEFIFFSSIEFHFFGGRQIFGTCIILVFMFILFCFKLQQDITWTYVVCSKPLIACLLAPDSVFFPSKPSTKSNQPSTYINTCIYIHKQGQLWVRSTTESIEQVDCLVSLLALEHAMQNKDAKIFNSIKINVFR